MAYEVILNSSARKAVRSLSEPTKRRVLRALKDLEELPRPPGSKALQGHDDLLRVRVGDYRIVYRVHDDILEVLVVRIAHRREVYRGL